MSKDYRQELETMKRLMEYGLNESKQTNADNSGILEYSQMGADGKTYGIIREGTKYFIKVAPEKHTKVLTEDFDYLGGFLGKKPFDSYTKASKALNLHLISLNEDGSKPVKSQFNLNESAEWQTKDTVESRKELNRFYELVSKVDNLLNENNHYINEDKNNPYTDKSTASYNQKNGGGHKGNIGTQQPLGITEEGFTDNDQHDAEAMQKKYQNANMGKSGFGDHNIDEDGGNPYQEKPTKKNMNEGKKRVIKLSEEQKKQVLAWRDDRAFVHDNVDTDRSHGTHIGDTAPWDEPVNEAFETEEWGSEGLPSSAGIGDAKKYKDPFDNLTRQPMNEMDEIRESIGEGSIAQNGELLADTKNIIKNSLSGADEPDEFEGDELPEEDGDVFEGYLRESVNRVVESVLNDIADENGMYGDEYSGGDSTLDAIPDTDEKPNEGEDYGDPEGWDDDDVLSEPDEEEPVPDDDPIITGWGEDDWHPQRDPNGGLDDPDELSQEDEDFSDELYEGVVLNDFGKHPAYRKKPMTLPANADGSEWGEDWNDESAKNELPFGRKIGKSDPFNQAVDAITNAVVDVLGKKKKLTEATYLKVGNGQDNQALPPVDNQVPPMGQDFTGGDASFLGGEQPQSQGMDMGMDPGMGGADEEPVMGANPFGDEGNDNGMTDDPEKKVESLIGKASSIIRKELNSDGINKHEDKKKEVLGMLVSAVIDGMDDEERNSVIDYLDSKLNGEGESDGDDSSDKGQDNNQGDAGMEEPEGGMDNAGGEMPQEPNLNDSQQQPMMEDIVMEITNTVLDNAKNLKPDASSKIANKKAQGYKSRPFKA